MRFVLFVSFFVVLAYQNPSGAESHESSEKSLRPLASPIHFPNPSPSVSPDTHISFSGKGAAFIWDVGVIQALYQNVPTLRDMGKQAVVTGSSSGSVLTAYLSCYGFSEASIRNLTDKLRQFDKYSVNDHEDKKSRVLRKIPTEYSLDAIRSMIEQLIPDEMEPGKKCVPRIPTLIVASNAEMLHTGKGPSGGMAFRDRLIRERKTVDNNLNVHSGPIRGGRQVIGKACTYFVDRTMFEKLANQPRLCDLRLMETAEDLRNAIYASISEPTFFPWIREQEPWKLLTDAGMGNYGDRHYNGGYPMLVGGVEDVKKLYPEIATISTGRPLLERSENMILKRWYAINANGIEKREWNFVDMEVSVPAPIWDDMVKNKGTQMPDYSEFKRGYDRTQEVLNGLRSGANGRLKAVELDKKQNSDDAVWFR